MTSSNSSPPGKQRRSKGTVQIKVSNSRLQLVFSWQGQRYYLSIGLPDIPLNRKGAERVARQIELDFVSGNFDPSLDIRLYYAPFVKFLFWTGCRPCEAIGLRWGNVSPDCSRVHFCESIVEVSGRLERRYEDKTAVKQWFSCPPRLKELLQQIRPEIFGSDDLVFPSPTGKAMVESNFSDRAWSRILEKVGLASKDGIKMTPYNCRDTFITLQATQGNSSTTIARWVGNIIPLLSNTENHIVAVGKVLLI